MDFSHILNDRESGSVEVLKHLIIKLEEELKDTDMGVKSFNALLNTLREKLKHFAAIDNFLVELIAQTGNKKNFPGEALRFIAVYKLYWKDSVKLLAENFLRECEPEGLTLLTHSHSQTIISLLIQLRQRQISFQVLQTLSSPGEEGKKSLERMHQYKIPSELIQDSEITDALAHSDIILMGCDALLEAEFLNKLGSRFILEQAKKHNRQSLLVTESRKKMTRPEWKNEISDLSLFEWVPLDLIDRLVTEK